MTEIDIFRNIYYDWGVPYEQYLLKDGCQLMRVTSKGYTQTLYTDFKFTTSGKQLSMDTYERI